MWQIHSDPHTKSIVSSGRRDPASVCFGGKSSTLGLQIIVLRKPFMFAFQFFLAGRKPSKNHCASGCQFRSVPVYPWLRKSQRPPSLLLYMQWESGPDVVLLCGAWVWGQRSQLSVPPRHPAHLVTHLTFLSRGWRDLLDNLKRKKKMNKWVEISIHLLSKRPAFKRFLGGVAIITTVMGSSKADVFLGRITQ